MDYDFVKVSLKKDVDEQIKLICNDAKKYGIFISKSDLLRHMVYDGNVIEYTIKKIISEKSDKISDFDEKRKSEPLNRSA